MSARSVISWSSLAGGAILLGSCAVGLAGTNDAANPYVVINERNAFRLNPPPPPPPPAQAPPAVQPDVYLSGFEQTGDHLSVLLAVKTPNPDPHGHDLTSYLTLAEGDKKTVGSGTKQGVIEIVKAYADQGKVDIINSGTPVTLTMNADGFKGQTAAPVGHRQSAIVLKSTATEKPPPADDGTADAPPNAGIIPPQ